MDEILTAFNNMSIQPPPITIDGNHSDSFLDQVNKFFDIKIIYYFFHFFLQKKLETNFAFNLMMLINNKEVI